MNRVGLLWLHNDLRLHDNAALTEAVASCDQLLMLYATYAFPAARGQSYYYPQPGAARERFLHESLGDLAQQIRARGNALLYLEKASLSDLTALIQAHRVSDVFYSRSADYDHQQRVRALRQQLPKLHYHALSTATLFAERPMLTLPRVFSDFRDYVERHRHLLRQQAALSLREAPTSLPPPPVDFPLHLLYQRTLPDAQTGAFLGGERQALTHLARYFDSDAPQHYKATRNALDGWTASSKCSPYLANGSLSVRQLLDRLRRYEREVACNESTYWLWFELLWREYFYWYAETHGAKLFAYRGIAGKRRRACFYPERFARWQHGTTPYPLVNACMNELRETGYLSNRGRQIAASCLIHELGLDWRYGATYFEQQLMDYDVASNWGNWQYIAGVGADPRGGRHFNLDKQSRLYDPDGAYVAKWRGKSEHAMLDSVDAADWPIMPVSHKHSADE